MATRSSDKQRARMIMMTTQMAMTALGERFVPNSDVHDDVDGHDKDANAPEGDQDALEKRRGVADIVLAHGREFPGLSPRPPVSHLTQAMCLTKDVRTRSHPSNMTQLGTLARIGGSAKTVSVLIPSRQKTFPALPKTIAHATGRTRISFGESN
ncbi:hypothetical protein HYQ46_002398 [Verticillium longisporum]|nr:hypothetical protein HYQ46_002398 [Verticillium longisporum]